MTRVSGYGSMAATGEGWRRYRGGRLTICSNITLTNYPDMGTVMSPPLDNRSSEQPTCSGSDANHRKESVPEEGFLDLVFFFHSLFRRISKIDGRYAKVRDGTRWSPARSLASRVPASRVQILLVRGGTRRYGRMSAGGKLIGNSQWDGQWNGKPIHCSTILKTGNTWG